MTINTEAAPSFNDLFAQVDDVASRFVDALHGDESPDLIIASAFHLIGAVLCHLPPRDRDGAAAHVNAATTAVLRQMRACDRPEMGTVH